MTAKSTASSLPSAQLRSGCGGFFSFYLDFFLRTCAKVAEELDFLAEGRSKGKEVFIDGVKCE